MSTHQLYLFFKNKYEQKGGLTVINDSNIHNLVKLYITEKNKLPNDLKDKNINNLDVSNTNTLTRISLHFVSFGKLRLQNLMKMQTKFAKRNEV